MNAHAKAAHPTRPAEAKTSAAPAAREAAPQPGNMALQEFLRSGAIRPQLTIGSPDDPAETEADRMAQQATAPCACGGGGCAGCSGGKPTLRRQINPAAPAAGGNTAMARAAAFGGSTGKPLPLALRAQFEPRFGADFSSVRIHDTTAAATTAAKISANAYTAGNDIGFARGQFAPDTARGQKLLAHELAHTMQNNGATLRRSPLDPANPVAWDHYADAGHRDESYHETIDQAGKDADKLGKDLNAADAPKTDAERDAMDAKIETLIRLRAVAMVGTHRAQIVDRQTKFMAMLKAVPPLPEGEAGPTATAADRRADTAEAIRTAARWVMTLNAGKERLESNRNTLDGAVRINDGTTTDDLAALYEAGKFEPPRDFLAQVGATKEKMAGLPRGNRKLVLFDLRNYLMKVRAGQIGNVEKSLAEIYDKFPFLADLSAQKITTGHDLSKTKRTIVASGLLGLLVPVLGPFAAGALAGEDKEMDDDTLLAAVQASFGHLLENTDASIAKVGSGSINPLDLPGAVAAAKGGLPPPLQTELARLQENHEVFKFGEEMAFTLGIAVLAALSGGAAALGYAAVATGLGAGAAGLGAVQLAGQAKDLSDRHTLASAATNPQGELLGVSAPGTLELVGFAVGALLTAVDLAGIAGEIAGAKPHFAEPHGAPASEAPHETAPHETAPGGTAPREPGGDPHAAAPDGVPAPGAHGTEIPSGEELLKDPPSAAQVVNEHPETIVDNTPGKRKAALKDHHEVVEVEDAGGVHCELHSARGPTIPCPKGWGESAPKDAAAPAPDAAPKPPLMLPPGPPPPKQLPPSSTSFTDVAAEAGLPPGGTGVVWSVTPDGTVFPTPPVKGVPIYAPDGVTPPASYFAGPNQPRNWVMSGPLQENYTPFDVLPGAKPTTNTLSKVRSVKDPNQKGAMARDFISESSGGQTEVTYHLSGGQDRRTDAVSPTIAGKVNQEVKNYKRYLGTGGTAREVPLDKRMRIEIAGDIKIMKEKGEQAVWVFTDAPPSAGLAGALDAAGIPHIVSSDRLPE